jgi:hypothetical protein
MQIGSLDTNWYTGLLNLKTIFGSNNTELRRYLWLYFQKVYNGTYNTYSLFWYTFWFCLKFNSYGIFLLSLKSINL